MTHCNVGCEVCVPASYKHIDGNRIGCIENCKLWCFGTQNRTMLAVPILTSWPTKWNGYVPSRDDVHYKYIRYLKWKCEFLVTFRNFPAINFGISDVGSSLSAITTMKYLSHSIPVSNWLNPKNELETIPLWYPDCYECVSCGTYKQMRMRWALSFVHFSQELSCFDPALNACYFVWVWNLVARIEGGTYAEGIWE